MSTVQAIAVFLSLAAIAAVWWVRLRHRSFTIPQLILWYLAKLLVRIQWRASQPPWPLRPGEGAVVICNHRSSVDPFFIQTIADRPMRWMVAREYFQHWILGPFLRTCTAIPVGRGGVDTAATKAAIRFAEAGGWVGMLPEGRINRSDDLLLPVRPGAVLVALRARVPILPCYIEGSPRSDSVTGPLWKRARVRVAFGELMDLAPYYDREGEQGLLQDLTLQAARRIATLAGQHDFEPKLAGRRWNPAADGWADEAPSNSSGD